MNSRDKGVRGERLWRDLLREAGWSEARRGQQFSGGADSPDVVGGPDDWHPEVKFVQALNVRAAYAQATRDAKGKRPYVAWKKNNQPWLVVMSADDFFSLLRHQLGSPAGEGPHLGKRLGSPAPSNHEVAIPPLGRDGWVSEPVAQVDRGLGAGPSDRLVGRPGPA